jgi:hypothetical protein
MVLAHLVRTHQLNKLWEQVALDETGVNLRHTVAKWTTAVLAVDISSANKEYLHLGTADDGQVGHPNKLWVPLLDDAKLAEVFDALWPSLGDLVEVLLVDQVDDGEVSGEQVGQERGRPLLKGLREDCFELSERKPHRPVLPNH